ncbi:hypothetical protein EX30DRAFT_398361 [Ascodesmis nigricans]|uniref:Uncharacterized protein n=1 Tax=Ascodesmis nigricans TaxID=341454 RepID=A0A4S2MKX0_9PEZI|nr:hypothetical protein EX30DRAFT_398361 [Ascodesmis nigricans]
MSTYQEHQRSLSRFCGDPLPSFLLDKTKYYYCEECDDFSGEVCSTCNRLFDGYLISQLVGWDCWACGDNISSTARYYGRRMSVEIKMDECEICKYPRDMACGMPVFLEYEFARRDWPWRTFDVYFFLK